VEGLAEAAASKGRVEMEIHARALRATERQIPGAACERDATGPQPTRKTASNVIAPRRTASQAVPTVAQIQSQSDWSSAV